MAFTVREFRDLTRLLEEHPEWQAELRRLLLTTELLSLPDIVRDLADQVRALAEAQRRTEERLGALTLRVDALAEVQRRTEERLDALVEAQQRTEEQIHSLTEEIHYMTDEVGSLKGMDLERRYREKAPAYFDDLLRRIHALSTEELATLLDEAVEQGRLSWEQRKEILESDVVVRGHWREDGEETYLVVEVSVGIRVDDVRRAAERAELLGRVHRAVPVVAGQRISLDARQTATDLGVWRVIDGRAIPPTE